MSQPNDRHLLPLRTNSGQPSVNSQEPASSQAVSSEHQLQTETDKPVVSTYAPSTGSSTLHHKIYEGMSPDGCAHYNSPENKYSLSAPPFDVYNTNSSSNSNLVSHPNPQQRQRKASDSSSNLFRPEDMRNASISSVHLRQDGSQDMMSSSSRASNGPLRPSSGARGSLLAPMASNAEKSQSNLHSSPSQLSRSLLLQHPSSSGGGSKQSQAGAGMSPNNGRSPLAQQQQTTAQNHPSSRLLTPLQIGGQLQSAHAMNLLAHQQQQGSPFTYHHNGGFGVLTEFASSPTRLARLSNAHLTPLTPSQRSSATQSRTGSAATNSSLGGAGGAVEGDPLLDQTPQPIHQHQLASATSSGQLDQVFRNQLTGQNLVLGSLMVGSSSTAATSPLSRSNVADQFGGVMAGSNSNNSGRRDEIFSATTNTNNKSLNNINHSSTTVVPTSGNNSTNYSRHDGNQAPMSFLSGECSDVPIVVPQQGEMPVQNGSLPPSTRALQRESGGARSLLPPHQLRASNPQAYSPTAATATTKVCTLKHGPQQRQETHYSLNNQNNSDSDDRASVDMTDHSNEDATSTEDGTYYDELGSTDNKSAGGSSFGYGSLAYKSPRRANRRSPRLTAKDAPLENLFAEPGIGGRAAVVSHQEAVGSTLIFESFLNRNDRSTVPIANLAAVSGSPVGTAGFGSDATSFTIPSTGAGGGGQWSAMESSKNSGPTISDSVNSTRNTTLAPHTTDKGANPEGLLATIQRTAPTASAVSGNFMMPKQLNNDFSPAGSTNASSRGASPLVGAHIDHNSNNNNTSRANFNQNVGLFQGQKQPGVDVIMSRSALVVGNRQQQHGEAPQRSNTITVGLVAGEQSKPALDTSATRGWGDDYDKGAWAGKHLQEATAVDSSQTLFLPPRLHPEVTVLPPYGMHTGFVDDFSAEKRDGTDATTCDDFLRTDDDHFAASNNSSSNGSSDAGIFGMGVLAAKGDASAPTPKVKRNGGAHLVPFTPLQTLQQNVGGGSGRSPQVSPIVGAHFFGGLRPPERIHAALFGNPHQQPGMVGHMPPAIQMGSSNNINKNTNDALGTYSTASEDAEFEDGEFDNYSNSTRNNDLHTDDTAQSVSAFSPTPRALLSPNGGSTAIQRQKGSKKYSTSASASQGRQLYNSNNNVSAPNNLLGGTLPAGVPSQRESYFCGNLPPPPLTSIPVVRIDRQVAKQMLPNISGNEIDSMELLGWPYNNTEGSGKRLLGGSRGFTAFTPSTANHSPTKDDARRAEVRGKGFPTRQPSVPVLLELFTPAMTYVSSTAPSSGDQHSPLAFVPGKDNRHQQHDSGGSHNNSGPMFFARGAAPNNAFFTAEDATATTSNNTYATNSTLYQFSDRSPARGGGAMGISPGLPHLNQQQNNRPNPALHDLAQGGGQANNATFTGSTFASNQTGVSTFGGGGNGGTMLEASGSVSTFVGFGKYVPPAKPGISAAQPILNPQALMSGALGGGPVPAHALTMSPSQPLLESFLYSYAGTKTTVSGTTHGSSDDSSHAAKGAEDSATSKEVKGLFSGMMTVGANAAANAFANNNNNQQKNLSQLRGLSQSQPFNKHPLHNKSSPTVATGIIRFGGLDEDDDDEAANHSPKPNGGVPSKLMASTFTGSTATNTSSSVTDGSLGTSQGQAKGGSGTAQVPLSPAPFTAVIPEDVAELSPQTFAAENNTQTHSSQPHLSRAAEYSNNNSNYNHLSSFASGSGGPQNPSRATTAFGSQLRDAPPVRPFHPSDSPLTFHHAAGGRGHHPQSSSASENGHMSSSSEGVLPLAAQSRDPFDGSTAPPSMVAGGGGGVATATGGGLAIGFQVEYLLQSPNVDWGDNSLGGREGRQGFPTASTTDSATTTPGAGNGAAGGADTAMFSGTLKFSGTTNPPSMVMLGSFYAQPALTTASASTTQGVEAMTTSPTAVEGGNNSNSYSNARNEATASRSAQYVVLGAADHPGFWGTSSPPAVGGHHISQISKNNSNQTSGDLSPPIINHDHLAHDIEAGAFASVTSPTDPMECVATSMGCQRLPAGGCNAEPKRPKIKEIVVQHSPSAASPNSTLPHFKSMMAGGLVGVGTVLTATGPQINPFANVRVALNPNATAPLQQQQHQQPPTAIIPSKPKQSATAIGGPPDQLHPVLQTSGSSKFLLTLLPTAGPSQQQQQIHGLQLLGSSTSCTTSQELPAFSPPKLPPNGQFQSSPNPEGLVSLVSQSAQTAPQNPGRFGIAGANNNINTNTINPPMVGNGNLLETKSVYSADGTSQGSGSGSTGGNQSLVFAPFQAPIPPQRGQPAALGVVQAFARGPLHPLAAKQASPGGQCAATQLGVSIAGSDASSGGFGGGVPFAPRFVGAGEMSASTTSLTRFDPEQ